MARPVKYNWAAIREAYEGGLNREDICRKYRVSNKLLGNQIRTEGWVVNGSINADVDAFYAGAHKMAQNLENLHPDMKETFDSKRLGEITPEWVERGVTVADPVKVSEMIKPIEESKRTVWEWQGKMTPTLANVQRRYCELYDMLFPKE